MAAHHAQTTGGPQGDLVEMSLEGLEWLASELLNPMLGLTCDPRMLAFGLVLISRE